jgi:hypothetical protein
MRKLAGRLFRPRREGRNDLTRICRGAWLYVGIPFLLLSAVLVGTRRAPGLADFMFWLGAIWIIVARYVESGCSSGEFSEPSRAELRQWGRFSGILVMAAASLYALAKIVAALNRS